MYVVEQKVSQPSSKLLYVLSRNVPLAADLMPPAAYCGRAQLTECSDDWYLLEAVAEHPWGFFNENPKVFIRRRRALSHKTSGTSDGLPSVFCSVRRLPAQYLAWGVPFDNFFWNSLRYLFGSTRTFSISKHLRVFVRNY